jgi:hypothetical protein
MFEITREWIHSHRSGSGGWNREQLESIEVMWPPAPGWIKQVAGRSISDEQKLKFENLRGMTLKRKKAGESRNAKLLGSPTPQTNGREGSREPASHQTPRGIEQ